MRHSMVHDVEQQIGSESCVVRATNARKGRTTWIEPERSPMKQLHYGRIILERADEPARFENHDHETGLICLKGSAAATVDGQTFQMVPYDSLYIPRDSAIEVRAGEKGCD